MVAVVSRNDAERFRSIIGQRLGLNFDDGKLDFLADILRQRLEATDSKNLSSYARRLELLSASADEIRSLAAILTVGETFFFRNNDHFRALVDVVVPYFSKRRRTGDRNLRILSAGCASGEEAYTIAILLRERFPELASGDVSIRGIDINAAVVTKAMQARFSTWALRETPAGMRAKYFRADGRDLMLDDSLRAAVKFEERNLLDNDPLFWRPDSFDVVFCRNVTMYFSPDVMRAVIGRITRSLTTGGFLFLGHAETLRGISQDFHLRHTHDTFYYQRRLDHEARADDFFCRTTPREEPLKESLVSVADAGDSWFDIIQQASARIAALAQSSELDSSDPYREIQSANSALPLPRWDSTIAIELLRRERFAEAMEYLRSLPPETKTDPDAQLLLAVLLTNSGDVPEAERVCRHLLAFDELNAGAQYLMALCREHEEDPNAAVEHDQAAIYLDSAFAMPHLHLGLIAKRLGNAESAKTAFARALDLLAKEDTSRILLFGGGFTREALVDFCKAELRSLGAAS